MTPRAFSTSLLLLDPAAVQPEWLTRPGSGGLTGRPS